LRRSAALKEWLRLFNRHFILRNALREMLEECNPRFLENM
jgi:hypothetical protein